MCTKYKSRATNLKGWQKEITELVEAKRAEDAINKAKEIDQITGEHEEVASFLIDIGIKIGSKDLSALLLFTAAEEIAKEGGKNFARQNRLIAHYNHGVLLHELKRYEEAEGQYKAALDIDPRDANAHNNYGTLLRELKRYKEAEAQHRAALDIDPKDARARNNYGTLLLELKRHKEAEVQYKEALRIYPNYARAHNNYGTLLLDLKRYEEAEAQFKEALKINPNYVDVRYNYGALLLELNRYEEAEGQYKAALDIDPRDANAHNNYGIFLAKLMRFREAEEQYAEAIKLVPNHPYYNFNLGLIFILMSDYANAKNQFNRARYLFDTDQENRNKSEACYYWALGGEKLKQDDLGDAEKYYLLACESLKAENIDLSTSLATISKFLALDRQILTAMMESHTLDELRLKILPIKDQMDGMSVSGLQEIDSKLVFVKALAEGLELKGHDQTKLQAIKNFLRKEHFYPIYHAFNALDSFLVELEDIHSLEEIDESKQKELLMLLSGAKAIDGKFTAIIADRLVEKKITHMFKEIGRDQ